MSLFRCISCIIVFVHIANFSSGSERHALWADTIQVDLGADQVKCAGDTFAVYTHIVEKKYQWYYKETDLHPSYTLHSDTNNYIRTILPGIYYVEVTDDTGSYGTDTVRLKYLEPLSAGINSVPNFFNDSVCIHTPVTFYLHTSETGDHPVYQWYKNGQAINGANDTIYIDSALHDLDIIYCSVTRTICEHSTPVANSNTIFVQFKIPGNAVEVDIAGPVSDTVCNDTLHFIAKTKYITPNVEYAWYRNGILESISPSYITFQATNGDKIKLNVFSGDHCQQNDGWGFDSVQLNNVQMNLPLADFNYQVIGDKLVQFVNSSQNSPSHISLHQYYWDFDDGDTSIEKNPVHQFTDAKTYHVRLIAYNFCGNDDQVKTVEILNTGITNKNYRNVMIYPNPSSGKVFIDINTTVNEDFFMYVRDLTGRIVKQEKIIAASGHSEFSTADLAPGIYMIELYSDQLIYNSRLVIAKN
jgi:PKD repeat protein